MKVLVTGGAGYIGSHTCKLLVETGHQPLIFDNLSTGHRELARFGTFFHGDIGEQQHLSEAFRSFRPDAVIHFAASAYVGESMRAPRAYHRNNVVGTLNLLDAMRSFDVTRLVFSSSCATYGVPSQVPIHEDVPQQPINPYGRSKLICEQMMRDISNAGELSCIALRYFNASGADAGGRIGELHDPETHVIPLILEGLAGDDDSFTIFGNDYDTPDGTCIRDYLHVSDLASAHVKALSRLSDLNGFEAMNLGTGSGYSVRELIAAAERVAGRPLRYREAQRRPGDPPALVADPRRAAERLGWVAEHSELDNIIETAWRWLRSEHNPARRRPSP